ncbi:MAG: hypothetical protein WDO15_28780 [Bacteroidota bacterium]
MKYPVVILLMLAACTAPQTSETKEDSVAVVSEDTLAVDPVDEENINDESHEAVGADTTLLNEIVSAFKTPQFNNKIAFVYRDEGLNLYASLNDVGDSTKALDVIYYGETLKLAEPLINNQPSDKIIIEGFKGRYIAVTTDDGTKGYTFSGYLTNFSIPRTTEGIVEYFRRTLHLAESPVKITSMALMDDTPEWWKTKYQFESDIIINDDGYYEGGSTYVTLPASCTMQEGFLLLRTFAQMELFAKAFTTYPTENIEKKVDEFNSATVQSDREGVVNISLSNDTECSDLTSVVRDNGRIQVGRGGGC